MPSILKTYFKRGLYALLVLFMGNLFLFGNIGEGQSAWAQGNTPTQSTQQRLTEKLTDRTVYAATFNKILYILIRPLLVVAGWAMDNGMIYGEFFGFDSALWTIWNLTKNIANFALGFLFLYVLFKNLFGSWNAGKEMKTLITNTLVAGILIQASRFLTAVAIDISTIATYGIGGLPISIMGNATTDIKDTAILWVTIPEDIKQIGLDPKQISSIKIFHTTEDWRLISPCATARFKDNNNNGETLIIGRTDIYGPYSGDANTKTKENICHYNGDIYWFDKESEYLDIEVLRNRTDKEEAKNTYANYLNNFPAGSEQFSSKEHVEKEIENGSILQLPGDRRSRVFTGDGEGGLISRAPGIGLDIEKKRLSDEATVKKVSELLESSASYVGVFSVLYTTLLTTNEMWLTDEGDVGTYPLVLNTTINVAYTLALVVPLLALVVVLLGRIIVLWVFIAIAPILILLKVFEKQVKIDFIKKDNMFSLESIGSLLLAPVLISFAVSLSTMFIILIKKITTTNITSNDTTSIMGLFELNIKGGGVDFSKLLISIMGIGIVRFLLFWAIEQTKIGKSVWGALKKGTESLIGNAPIIPLPGGGAVGVKSFYDDGRSPILDKAGTAMEQVMSDRNMRNLEGTALSGFFKEEIDNMNQKDQSLYKDKVREAGGLNSIDVNNYVENIAKNGNKSTYEVKFDVDGNSVKVGGGTRKIEFSADDISQNNDTYIKVIEAINKNISTETDKKKLENYSSFIKNSLTKDNMKNVTSRTQLETLINTDKTINTEEKNQVRKNLQDQERTFEENWTKNTYTLDVTGKVIKKL